MAPGGKANPQKTAELKAREARRRSLAAFPRVGKREFAVLAGELYQAAAPGRRDDAHFRAVIEAAAKEAGLVIDRHSNAFRTVTPAERVKRASELKAHQSFAEAVDLMIQQCDIAPSSIQAALAKPFDLRKARPGEVLQPLSTEPDLAEVREYLHALKTRVVIQVPSKRMGPPEKNKGLKRLILDLLPLWERVATPRTASTSDKRLEKGLGTFFWFVWKAVGVSPESYGSQAISETRLHNALKDAIEKRGNKSHGRRG